MSRFYKYVPSLVDGSVVVQGMGTPSAPATATATTSSAIAVPANADRKGLIIINLGTANVSFGCGTTAVTNSGITLTPSGTWVMDSYTYTPLDIYAVSSTSCILSIQEYV